ncbi:GreA/GreB family elongation factor [Deinococcus peraridilitoris]|uniref:Transcription elongation factor n=1 Tax=Deinococcus peraridilitoris (strain DSM 19664 / LMG 22246 / CIP 109416 / KR-200) TaxID=937777 RepID=L0A199_DEIPD|nr:GreA/GreB family elongation factor [Deinococcus peraridilitoris]AFZ66795.1 transcription elongation factor [Deinococcus peraridilitoris DSM 19664]
MAREVQVTREGYVRLEQALEEARRRRTEVTQQLSALLDDAMDLEDRSLQAAQNDTTSLDARIVELEDTLARAVIVDNHGENDGEILLGSIVVLHDDHHDRELRVQLVNHVEVTTLDEGITRVADDSPVGKALPGRRVGDSFEVDLGDHRMRYTVKSVE